jgi:uncharacterized protein
MKIAIVGTGISGLVCAHHLHGHHDVTVFEANDYVGGHTHTVDVTLDGATHAVDTGFIVYNEQNYPEFTRLLGELSVATQPTTMSFSVRDESTGLEYRADGFGGLFAQRANLVDRRFGRMLTDVVRFNRRARSLLARHRTAVEAGDQTGAARLENLTLDDLVVETRCSPMFVSHYLVPLGAAIWSADPDRFGRFPAVSWSRFMDNHGLLHVRGTPHWRTVTGGSRRYVDALTAPFADRIRLDTPVSKIRRNRHPDGGVEVEVLSSPAGPERFDRVILASHSDQALALLSDPSDAERDILGALTYQPNVATLHTDARFLPRRRAARACWNAHVGTPVRARDGGPATSLTYWMNALQGLDSPQPLLVTLNRHDEIDPDTVLGRFDYDHPMFDLDALAAQRRRAEIQGVDGTWFAGAYWGYGFHEDGVQSGLDVCRAIEADTRMVQP